MHSDECENCMNVAHTVPWPCPRLHSEVLLIHYLFNNWSTFVSLLHAKTLRLKQFPLLHPIEIPVILTVAVCHVSWIWDRQRLTLIFSVRKWDRSQMQWPKQLYSWEKQGRQGLKSRVYPQYVCSTLQTVTPSLLSGKEGKGRRLGVIPSPDWVASCCRVSTLYPRMPKSGSQW